REFVRHALEPSIFADGVRAHAMRESFVGNESCTQVFGVMRNAGRRNITSFRIADDWSVAIRSRQPLPHVVRNSRSRIWFEYLGLSVWLVAIGILSREIAPHDG